MFALNPPRQKPTPVGSTISIKQLQHPPARKAVQAFASARELSEAGEYVRAAEALEKAVEISPGFAEAYTNLAVQHIRMGKYEEAAAESRRAMELSTPNARDLSNLAVSLWATNHLTEALRSAERALTFDPGFAQAH